MFNVSISTAGIPAKMQRLQAETVRRVTQIVSDEADFSEQEFLKRIGEQIALSPAKVRRLVRLEKRGTTARLIASGEAVRLEEYPHRQAKGGVEVRVNPGGASFVSDAFVSRRGHIVRRGSRGEIPRQLFGPGVNQIAHTEFPQIAELVERRMAARLSR